MLYASAARAARAHVRARPAGRPRVHARSVACPAKNFDAARIFNFGLRLLILALSMAVFPSSNSNKWIDTENWYLSVKGRHAGK